MVEYIIILINDGKQDEMLVTLEARARHRNFNCACKFLSPVLQSSAVCLFPSFPSSAHRNRTCSICPQWLLLPSRLVQRSL
jgi:hypothetical protein